MHTQKKRAVGLFSAIAPMVSRHLATVSSCAHANRSLHLESMLVHDAGERSIIDNWFSQQNSYAMAELKSERHHWWPVCVSSYWKDDGGCVHWVLPNNQVRRIPPKKLGMIGNGHHIKLSHKPGEATVWDQSFENEFQRADDNFPRVIDWLEKLDRQERPGAMSRCRFLAQKDNEEKVNLLIEGLISLAVRSPMTREAAVRLAEKIRGPLPERERNALIGLNIRNRQSEVTASAKRRGKVVIIYSPDREFIFGDGFFHNITSPGTAPTNPKILAPLTPRISVLFTRPMSYLVEPRLMTLVLSAKEADGLNDTVQVYAKDALFYRSEKPTITEHYRVEEHRCYVTHDNPVDQIIDSTPGVSPRDKSLDYLLRGFNAG